MPQPCDLKLEVYADDGVTMDWEVGYAGHAYPYLEPLSQYATQELDVPAGAASIGTVSVSVVDAPQIAGDQNSGFVTEKLAALGAAALAGRRCRLLRWDGSAWRRVADGPAGTPKLAATYAAYGWDIKDTREQERRLRAFDQGGTKTLLPRGIYPGYGYDAGTDTYLVDPTTPLRGAVEDVDLIFPADTRKIRLALLNSLAQRTLTRAEVQALSGSLVYAPDPVLVTGVGWGWEYRITFTNVRALWRAYGTSDPWQAIEDTLQVHGVVFFSPLDEVLPDPLPDPLPDGSGSLLFTLPPSDDLYEVTDIYLGDSAGSPNLPASGTEIDLILLTTLPPSKDHPRHIEGLTLGEYAQNCYDGLYSEPDVNGDPVPTGIQYIEADLLQLTTPVRLRLFEPVTNVRDHLEKVGYGPTGWTPALEADGAVSPVSQVPPADTVGLEALTVDNTEPSPDWDAGERIINILRFTYGRDYVPASDVKPATGDGLSRVDCLVEYRDEGSIARFGPQTLELDGSAFSALGVQGTGDAVVLPAQELGAQLAAERWSVLAPRYSLGAPAWAVRVRRDDLPDLRAGDFVVLDIPWLPDYVTGRRGLLTMAQVVTLGEDDCAWRQVVVEQAPPASS